MDKEKQKQAEEKYQQLQLLNENIKQVQKHMEAMETQKVELATLEVDLESLKEVKDDTEILVPVSSGIFAKAKIQDADKLIVNVGASTLVKKDIPNVKKLIKKQAEDLKKIQAEMLEDLKKMVHQAASVEEELKAIVS